MMSPIAGLRCTICRSPELAFAPDLISCSTCGQEWPVLGGVPVMFEAVAAESGDVLDDAAARQILSAFELPHDPITLLRLRTLVRKQPRFGGALIQVESRQFIDRVRSTGHEPAAATLGPRGEAPRDLVTVPRYRWPKSYMPRRCDAGGGFLANMRLENRGDVLLHKDGPGRATVALRWRHRDGTPAPATDRRTPLPIDLAPGQAVTVAVMVEPPSRPGAYLLEVTLVQEQVRWLEEDALVVPVLVQPGISPGAVPDGWTVLPEAPASYDADHLRGRALLADWLRDHAPPRPRVLEVGGNAVPMAAELDAALVGELVNVDVDLLGLQVGHMLAQRRGRRVQQLCADAFDLPFAAGHFDSIVIFASLHHFPDPAALLSQLSRRLRPGGFLGLFCEPVGHVWPGAITAPFLAELERGVNEQSFSLREYELMFRQAELDPAEVIVDFNSLKARLRHPRPDDLR